MARLGTRLKRWQEAGLIDSSTAGAIQAFERDHRGPALSLAAFRLGGLAILVGILSVVAANWDNIPDAVKLGVHFLLNIAAALWTWRAIGRDHRRRAEFGALALAGLTLTLLALIGQTYQTQAPDWVLPILWFALVSPLFWFATRSGYAALIWGLGYAAAAMASVFALEEVLGPLLLLHAWPLLLLVALALLVLWPRFIAARAEAAEALRQLTLIYVALTATGLSLLWYADTSDLFGDLREAADLDEATWWMILPGLAAVGAACALLLVCVQRWRPEGREGVDQVRAWTLGVGVLYAAFALPFVIPHENADFLAAVAFVLIWGALGAAASMADRRWLASLALFLIALRIFIAYLELFGGLLFTGVGLIASGLVVIGLTWGALRVHRIWLRRREAG